MAAAQGMNAKVFLNLGLIAALLALSIFMYYKAAHDVTPEMRITALKRDDVTRIVIEPRGAPAIKLEKHDGTWRLVAPLAASAEMTNLSRFCACNLPDPASSSTAQNGTW